MTEKQYSILELVSLFLGVLTLVSEQKKLWKQFVIVVSLVIFLIYVFNELTNILLSI